MRDNKKVRRLLPPYAAKATNPGAPRIRHKSETYRQLYTRQGIWYLEDKGQQLQGWCNPEAIVLVEDASADKQAQRNIRIILAGPMDQLSEIKLIRTDTTLDLSQKAEKNGQHLGSPKNELSPNL